MDEEIDRLVIGVRADTAGFARDLNEMRSGLSGGLGEAADAAGMRIETALVRALRTGKLGFDDLRKGALSAMNEIASAAIRSGIGAATGGAVGGGGLLATAGTLLGSLLGAPGRATGGPVSPGRAYTVGERGPELFVPTASGRIEPTPGAGGRAIAPMARERIEPVPAAGGRAVRDARVSIVLSGAGDDKAQALQRSGRQVARLVRRALEEAEG